MKILHTDFCGFEKLLSNTRATKPQDMDETLHTDIKKTSISRDLQKITVISFEKLHRSERFRGRDFRFQCAVVQKLQQ